MFYKLNPHRQVKIWLSNNKDLFMNQENQLRLIHMRVHNPNDLIHLIYSKQLLTEKSITDLQSFCDTHNIIPVSLEEDITPEVFTNQSATEIRLLELCQQEISALKSGGNLAAASDILRWLQPVYSRGIYSDLDVTPMTHHLPEEIDVEAPILMNIGSIKLSIARLMTNNLESISLNNDLIAVVGNDERALHIILKIQEYIIHAYENPAIYSEYYECVVHDTTHYITQRLGAICGALIAAESVRQNPCAILGDELTEMSLSMINSNPILIRHELTKKHSLSNIVFCREQVERMIPDAYVACDSQIQEYYANMLREIMPPAIIDGKTDDELITFEREKNYAMLLKWTVTAVTGPQALIVSMFNCASLSAEKIDEKIKPYTFKNYNLENEFNSLNSSGLHINTNEYLEKTSQPPGLIGDQAWTHAGALFARQREKAMHLAANKIASAYKAHLLNGELTHDKATTLRKI